MKRMNGNWVAVIILVVAYVYSVIQVLSISRLPGTREDDKTIRLIHWQLEPGYREGLQWAIDQYNELLHVKEAGIHVEQQGVTERVYGQFMNIHMISGTGPDIAEHGKTQLIKGNSVARFFQSLSDHVNEPNPYNAPELLPEGLDPQLAELLTNSVWSDTFIDGMKGGYDEGLNDYFAIPVSTFGSVRFFYNMRLVGQGKALIREALAQPSRPAWISGALISDTNPDGFLPETPELAAWVDNDSPPDSLGQLLLLSEAILQLAEDIGNDTLVPIAGSSYNSNDIGGSTYGNRFLSHIGEKLDKDYESTIDPIEFINGWQQGVWTLDDPAIREMFLMRRIFVRYYPPGFLGLDREQSQRRFVQGNAMMLATGGWDAGGILNAVKNQSDQRRFDIGITPAPLAIDGEIWHEYLAVRGSEAEFKTGVPFALNKQSAHPEFALDFLRFLTSVRINSGMNKRSGWLPVTIGAEPIESMRTFMPIADGLPPRRTLDLASQTLLAQIRNAASGNIKLVVSGEMSIDDFIEDYERTLNDGRLGANRQWFDFWQKSDDATISMDQSLNVEAVRQYVLGDESAARRRKTRLYKNVTNDQGYWIRQLWKQYHPDEPFPSK